MEQPCREVSSQQPGLSIRPGLIKFAHHPVGLTVFPLALIFADNTSFLGSVEALPDTFGLPADGLDSPSRHVYLPVVRTGCGHGTTAPSPIERAAVSEHDYQRAAGER